MHTNRQTFWNNTSASAASLGCIGWIYGNNLNTSAFSLIFNHLSKQSKPSIIRRKRKVSVFIHESERKIFNCNKIILSYKFITNFMQVIRALVSNLFMQSSDLAISFLLSIASFDLTRSMTLKSAQFSKTLSHPVRIFYQFASRKSCKRFQSNVNTNLIAGLFNPLFRKVKTGFLCYLKVAVPARNYYG